MALSLQQLDPGNPLAASSPLPALGGNLAVKSQAGGFAATAHPSATDAACAMLCAGGNAVDAAVAAAWALAVCEPGNSGLGGQTILLIGSASAPGSRFRTTLLDGHSRAPAAASLETIDRSQQRSGYHATTVPTTPYILETARQRFGRLSLPHVLEPAIRLAEDGFRATPLYRRQLGWCLKGLRASESASHIYLVHGQPYEAGQLFRQPKLADTLRRLARHGIQDFYTGHIARQIAADMQRHGGLMTLEDLASVGAPTEREPISTTYRGCTVVTAGLPAGGLQILRGLEMLAQHDVASGSLGDWYEALGETTYSVFFERESGALAASQSRRLNGAGWADVEEPGETTHLSTADAEGNIVALTQSIQSLFGARVACEPCGFLYNNYLTTCPREPHPHQLAPRCQPRSNAAPIFVFRATHSAAETAGSTDPNGREPHRGHAANSARPVLALGAAGSRRTTSALLHTISGVVDRGLSLAEAVDLPRFHVKLTRNSWLERAPETEPLVPRLARRFCEVQLRSRHSYAMGCVQAVEIHQDGTITGASDPRREGTAVTAQLLGKTSSP